jgi:hypothetical protein
MPSKAADWLEWLARFSLPAVAVTLLGVYVQSEKQLVLIQVQTKEIAEIKADLAMVKSTYATEVKLMETVKSIDQKLEIMVLRQQKGRQ